VNCVLWLSEEKSYTYVRCKFNQINTKKTRAGLQNCDALRQATERETDGGHYIASCSNGNSFPVRWRTASGSYPSVQEVSCSLHRKETHSLTYLLSDLTPLGVCNVYGEKAKNVNELCDRIVRVADYVTSGLSASNWTEPNIVLTCIVPQIY